jgi:23S rRNA pseudouridine1911/1915/1917 synthase
VERTWIVTRAQVDLRLDAFLRAQLPFLSRRELDGALRQECFTINGRSARRGDRVTQGDAVKFTGASARLAETPLPSLKLRVPVIYEDASLLVLDKPPGLDCHGFSGKDDQTLANFLVAGWPELIGIGKSRWQPGLVHRLDRETSGLVLIAKNQFVFDDLSAQFSGRSVEKIYLALVSGSTRAQGIIACALAHDPRDRRKMRAVLGSGKSPPKHKVWPALTYYRKLAEQEELSFLRLEMKTGVTHQLRAHLASIGHAIVGDALYGMPGEQPFGLKRHFLHASELRFRHPVLRNVVKLKAPLPAELREILSRLKMRFEPAN